MGYTDDDSIKNDIKIRLSALIKEDLPENVKVEDITPVMEFFKSKSKNQVALMTLAVDHEYRRISDDDPELLAKKQQLKSVTKTLRHLFKLFQFSFKNLK